MKDQQLWMVHLMASYYDNDSRMPGNVPIDERVFVIASSQEEAIKKAKPETQKVMREYRLKTESTKIIAVPMPLEGLVAARDSSGDGRLGYISTSKLSPVELSLKADRKQYRLAVCLVAID